MQTGASRRLVTCVFCDVVGSTSLGAQLDPETVRAVMERFFQEVRGPIERHGGTVEKFVGDAVLAVFGVPELHEDDALRAVRAAVEMRDALDRINGEIARSFGVGIEARTGIASGEVLAAEGPQEASFVTGQSVNVAARLQQAAGPGEIFLSSETRELVRGAVETKTSSIPLKGIGDQVEIHRLIRLLPAVAGRARRSDAPLVGREGELALLLHAFERTVADAGCHLCTILGTPGVGKTRLTEELIDRVGPRATVLRGRCLPYGEGITFYPVAEAIDEAASLTGHDSQGLVRQKVAGIVAEVEEGERIAELVAQAIGAATPSRTLVSEEIIWGLRMFFETIARRKPLILVFDDIQWGETTFLDMIEQTASWSREAPIMIVCPARPELLELRPSWAGGQRNALTVHLEPLSVGDCGSLVDHLLGSELPSDARRAIVTTSGGNALFVEEIVSMLIDSELIVRRGSTWKVTADLSRIDLPPTVATLVAARIDRLPPDERDTLERASIVGEVFTSSSVSVLGDDPDAAELEARLDSLGRKEMVRPTLVSEGERAHRFRHLVIRDVVYASLPKRRRAGLHRRYAEWLEARSGDRLDEVEEIVGYHLEQSHRYLLELGSNDEEAHELGERAGRRLAAAGERAAALGDIPATTNLLSRADALLPTHDERAIALLPDLADCLFQAGHTALAHLERASWELVVDPHAVDPERFRDATLEAVGVFEAQRAPRHLASAYEALAMYHRFFTGDMVAMAEAAERGLDAARAASDSAAASGNALQFGRALVMGPSPCDEALERLRDLIRSFAGDQMLEAAVGLDAAALHAALGRVDRARRFLERSEAVFAELGQRRWLAEVSSVRGDVERVAGRPEQAADALRLAFDEYRRRGEALDVALAAGALGIALSDLGRFDEVGALMREIAAASPPGGVEPAVSLERLRARTLAARGEMDPAMRALGVALEVAGATTIVSLHGEVCLDIASIRRARGDEGAGRQAAADALRLFQAKRNLAAAARAEAFLRASGVHPPAAS